MIYGCELWCNLSLTDKNKLNAFQHFVCKNSLDLPKLCRSDMCESFFWCLTYRRRDWRSEAFILWETLSFRPKNVNKKDISNEIIFLLTRSFRKSVWLYSWYYKGSPILQPYSLLVGFSKRRNLSRETLLEENCPQQCYYFTPFSTKSADVSWPWLPSFHRNFQRVKTLLDLEYTWKLFGNQTLQVHL